MPVLQSAFRTAITMIAANAIPTASAAGAQNGLVTHHQLQFATGAIPRSFRTTNIMPITVRHPTPFLDELLLMFISYALKKKKKTV